MTVKADLSQVRNLTLEQVNSANGDETTKTAEGNHRTGIMEEEAGGAAIYASALTWLKMGITV